MVSTPTVPPPALVARTAARARTSTIGVTARMCRAYEGSVNGTRGRAELSVSPDTLVRVESVSSRRETMLGFQPPAIGDEEIEAVAETLRSGWLTTGPRSAELERRF